MSALPDDGWSAEVWLDPQSIVFALGDVEWEPALLSALRHPSIRLNIVKRCLDAVELVAAVETSNAGHVFLSAELARLDLNIVSRLVKRGISITGVVDSRFEAQEIFLRQIGIENIVTMDVNRPGAGAASLASVMKPQPDVTRGAARALSLTPLAEDSYGKLVVVWGPPGSVGKSTVAMNLCDEIALSGKKVLLVDADIDAPSIAVMMAIVESPGGLPVALRRATAGRLDAAVLSDLVVEVEPDFSVLVGAGAPSHRGELRSPAFAALRNLARQIYDVVVIDLGSVPLPIEGLGEQASVATLDALDEADDVIIVGGPTLVDVQRLILSIESLKEALPETRPYIVINRSTPRADIAHALSVHCHSPSDSLRFVPDDTKVLSTCIRDGMTVREVAPKSKVRAHLQSVGQDLVSKGA